MEKELTYLGKALESPARPFVAILGGSKISGKIDVINNLLDKVNTLVIVGGMAYTFQRALGVTTGKSLVEEDRIEMAGQALKKAKALGIELLLPVDNVLADSFSNDAKTQPWDTSKNFPADWQGLDIGPKSVACDSRKSSPALAPLSGTDRPASSSSRNLRSEPTPSPKQSRRTRTPSPSSAAETRSPL